MPTPTPYATWQAKKYGAYGRSSQEAFDNAICTYNLLSSLGWSICAICGVYGNIEAESGYNPWRWEGDDVLDYGDPRIASSSVHGYGFPQFTPAGKYILDSNAQAFDGYAPNFDNVTGDPFDGDAQLRFIDQYADYIAKPAYPLSYEEYKVDMTSPEYSARAWLINYERPGDQSESVQEYRASIARYWYDILIEYDPSEPIPPEGKRLSTGANKFKMAFYLKPWWKRL